MNIRDGTIYIEGKALWCLARMTQKHNSQLSPADPRMTADELANEVLLEWIRKTKPALLDLWDKRRAIDEEALKV